MQWDLLCNGNAKCSFLFHPGLPEYGVHYADDMKLWVFKTWVEWGGFMPIGPNSEHVICTKSTCIKAAFI